MHILRVRLSERTRIRGAVSARVMTRQFTNARPEVLDSVFSQLAAIRAICPPDKEALGTLAIQIGLLG
jgi:hypothetical protein